MSDYVLHFREIDQTQIAAVGGKGANLGELSRIPGVRVPAGFCVTTDAFQRIMAEAPSIDVQLNQLSHVKPDDRDAIRALSAEVRGIVEQITIPDEIASAITASLAQLDASHVDDQIAFAVRSSATAEDSPTTSFAGQQDTYLNVVGAGGVLAHVSQCWASLFTERAVTYRLRNGIDHRSVRMAVVVQRMVFPQAAGILFTADPVTGHRKIASVEASFGLGEALVSGLVNADTYKVRDGEIVERAIGTKQLAIAATPAGGTREHAIELERQQQPALTDSQVVRLAEIGRQIEAHFGRPQDIEWCLVDDEFHIVQSRPITTLFPIPESGDEDNHVYLSVGHQQMMTDPIRPLGLSVWQLGTMRRMGEAGGRLWVDVTKILATPTARDAHLSMLEKSDPLTSDALKTILDRGDFIRTDSDAVVAPSPATAPLLPPSTIETDSAIPADLISHNDALIETLKQHIAGKSGSALLDFILADVQEMKKFLFAPMSMQVIMAGMEATWWLNEHMKSWLGDKNAADVLTQSVPHNITSEMGLALMDVADALRPHPAVVAFLEHVSGDGFLAELHQLDGGDEARNAIQGWLDKYGMRGVGEIDITRPRWSERPSMLLPIIVGHIKNFEPGAAAQRFAQGLENARLKEVDLLQRLRALREGDAKAQETKRMIDRVRTFAGYREYPKYGKIAREFVYKKALMAEADRLVNRGVLREKEDIFYLRFDELQQVVSTNHVDEQLIRARKEEFKSYQALTPPRVLTSDGEAISGSFRREDLPAGALVGLAVSAGTVEGRARVIVDLAKADLEPGDILVTAFTDPSWTPLFVAIKGLVTEVGGLMTHGAVIAREYGLPAVVSVANATRLIRDGQQIRVHGSDGYVEILS